MLILSVQALRKMHQAKSHCIATSGSYIHTEYSNTNIDTVQEETLRLPQQDRLACAAPSSTQDHPGRLSSRRDSTLLKLPLEILRLVLMHVLCFPQPLAIGIRTQRTKVTPRPTANASISISIVLTCKLVYHEGLAVFYSQNTFTTSNPSISKDFGFVLENVPVRNRQLIRRVHLDIDWGDELWAHLPLVARALKEMSLLRELHLHITTRPQTLDRHDASRFNLLRQCEILKAECKILKDMIRDLKALRIFRLVGFVDAIFAKKLEGVVARRCR